ncbi:hypothetical protein [Mycobacterium sp.]|uniref:hypothetical protein n=1 Tax=Mycobacterium sp. TaxID=1785 RepID=UPI003F951A85
MFRPAAREVTVEDGVVWAIAADKTFSVMRQDISVIANPYSAFTAHMRAIGASVVKMVETPPGL